MRTFSSLAPLLVASTLTAHCSRHCDSGCAFSRFNSVAFAHVRALQLFFTIRPHKADCSHHWPHSRHVSCRAIAVSRRCIRLHLPYHSAHSVARRHRPTLRHSIHLSDSAVDVGGALLRLVVTAHSRPRWSGCSLLHRRRRCVTASVPGFLPSSWTSPRAVAGTSRSWPSPPRSDTHAQSACSDYTRNT
ncbi:hypothetical protein PF006_g15533 [Phytophthora fragariae]|uniref:Secreted protein n=1 Tax=Phytophthora fragariae TaxID=53985 RepID=A0A6A3T819_9STRA|nr:hypothetical protein PF006_g15533 [Phytophthora fragariae]